LTFFSTIFINYDKGDLPKPSPQGVALPAAMTLLKCNLTLLGVGLTKIDVDQIEEHTSGKGFRGLQYWND
jgi:hypothetical protein